MYHIEMVETKWLRDRKINNFVALWCIVALGDVEICVPSKSFQKINIGWPQQPRTERISDISRKFNF